MEFKVGASLWAKPALDNKLALAHTDVAADFREKLGLPSGDSKSRAELGKQDGKDRSAYDAPRKEVSDVQETSELSASLHMAALIRQPQVIHLPGTVELYPLGLQAGHHLSQVPRAFLETLEGVLPTLDAKTSDKPAPVAENTVLHLQGQSQKNEHHAIAATMTAQQKVFSVPGIEVAPNQQILTYLSGKHPNRNYLVLPRGSGIELFIRDYHLAPAEQEALVADLLLHMQSMSERPEHIWVNGQCVWQAEPLLNTTRDESYGH